MKQKERPRSRGGVRDTWGQGWSLFFFLESQSGDNSGEDGDDDAGGGNAGAGAGDAGGAAAGCGGGRCRGSNTAAAAARRVGLSSQRGRRRGGRRGRVVAAGAGAVAALVLHQGRGGAQGQGAIRNGGVVGRGTGGSVGGGLGLHRDGGGGRSGGRRTAAGGRGQGTQVDGLRVVPLHAQGGEVTAGHSQLDAEVGLQLLLEALLLLGGGSDGVVGDAQVEVTGLGEGGAHLLALLVDQITGVVLGQVHGAVVGLDATHAGLVVGEEVPLGGVDLVLVVRWLEAARDDDVADTVAATGGTGLGTVEVVGRLGAGGQGATVRADVLTVVLEDLELRDVLLGQVGKGQEAVHLLQVAGAAAKLGQDVVDRAGALGGAQVLGQHVAQAGVALVLVHVLHAVVVAVLGAHVVQHAVGLIHGADAGSQHVLDAVGLDAVDLAVVVHGAVIHHSLDAVVEVLLGVRNGVGRDGAVDALGAAELGAVVGVAPRVDNLGRQPGLVDRVDVVLDHGQAQLLVVVGAEQVVQCAGLLSEGVAVHADGRGHAGDAATIALGLEEGSGELVLADTILDVPAALASGSALGLVERTAVGTAHNGEDGAAEVLSRGILGAPNVDQVAQGGDLGGDAALVGAGLELLELGQALGGAGGLPSSVGGGQVHGGKGEDGVDGATAAGGQQGLVAREEGLSVADVTGGARDLVEGLGHDGRLGVGLAGAAHADGLVGLGHGTVGGGGVPLTQGLGVVLGGATDGEADLGPAHAVHHLEAQSHGEVVNDDTRGLADVQLEGEHQAVLLGRGGGLHGGVVQHGPELDGGRRAEGVDARAVGLPVVHLLTAGALLELGDVEVGVVGVHTHQIGVRGDVAAKHGELARHRRRGVVDVGSAAASVLEPATVVTGAAGVTDGGILGGQVAAVVAGGAALGHAVAVLLGPVHRRGVLGADLAVVRVVGVDVLEDPLERSRAVARRLDAVLDAVLVGAAGLVDVLVVVAHIHGAEAGDHDGVLADGIEHGGAEGVVVVVQNVVELEQLGQAELAALLGTDRVEVRADHVDNPDVAVGALLGDELRGDLLLAHLQVLVPLAGVVILASLLVAHHVPRLAVRGDAIKHTTDGNLGTTADIGARWGVRWLDL
eukprot:308867_1